MSSQNRVAVTHTGLLEFCPDLFLYTVFHTRRIHYLSRSSPTHVCAFIPAPAARVVSSCHLTSAPPDEGSYLLSTSLTPTHYSQFCAWSVRYRVHYRYMSRG